jgi:hypothetical protein
MREVIKVLEFADQAGVQDRPPLGQPRLLSRQCSPVAGSIAKLVQEGYATLDANLHKLKP